MSPTPPSYIRAAKDGLILQVIVVPRARASKLLGLYDGVPKISLAAPPIEGRANDELVSFLTEVFGLPARNIELLRGDSSRRKSVLLRGISIEKATQVLESLVTS